MRNVTRITQTTLTMIRFLLPFLLVTPLLFLSTAPAFAQEGDSVLSQLDGAAQTVAMAINQARANAGLPPLALHPLLNAAAQNHVNDMVANYHYGHTGSDGSNVRQRVQRTGYASSTWASENWVSVNEPGMAIQWWMNSTVHRGNILNQNWHEFGIGVGRHPDNGHMIFVAVFAAGESGDAAQIIMPPTPEPLPIPAGGVNYTIQPGDTLLSIGLRYGVEWPVIATANGLSEFSLLQIGHVIRLPGVNNIGGPVTDNANAVNNESSSGASEEEATTGDVFVRRYTVQPGDTLVVIASIYGLSWQEVAAENGLGEYSVISVGKEIRIPGAVKRADTPATEETPVEETQANVATSAATNKSAAVETVAEDAATEKVSPPEYYTVKPGDTVISIALTHDLDWQELLQINNLSESSILQLGQALRIR